MNMSLRHPNCSMTTFINSYKLGANVLAFFLSGLMFGLGIVIFFLLSLPQVVHAQ